MMKKKLFKIATIPRSLNVILKGQFQFLNQYYEVAAVASPGKEHDYIKEQEGVDTHVIRIERHIHLWRDLQALFLLYRLFRKEKPYIIHSFTPKAGLLCAIAGFFAGVPHRIHTFTGLIFPYKAGFMFHLLKNMDRLTCFFSTKIFPEGEGVKQDLLKHKVTRKELKIVGNGNINGIDTNYFNVSEYLKKQRKNLRLLWAANDQTIIFCFIGRMVGDKGVNELVEAYTRLKFRCKNIRLLLVGPREQEFDPLKVSTIQKMESDSTIIETGFINDVRPFLAVADVFVLPSYREGFPNVVMQAGAMGLPSIVTDISGCNEIIKDQVNGIIIPPKNEKLLYNAMLELLQDEEKRSRLASVSRPMIVDRYEQQYFWNELLKEYQSLDNHTPSSFN